MLTSLPPMVRSTSLRGYMLLLDMDATWGEWCSMSTRPTSEWGWIGLVRSGESEARSDGILSLSRRPAVPNFSGRPARGASDPDRPDRSPTPTGTVPERAGTGQDRGHHERAQVRENSGANPGNPMA